MVNNMTLINSQNRWSPVTENLLHDFDTSTQKGIEAYLEQCQIMLQLLEQDDVKSEASALRKTLTDHVTSVIHERYDGKLSHAAISERWTVAQNIVKHIGAVQCLAYGVSDTGVLYQAALSAKAAHRNPHNQNPAASIAKTTLEEFSLLNRDEARAKRDPSSMVQLATRSETTTATAEGLFSTEAVRRHHEADTSAREILNARLERDGEAPLTPTLSLEMWAAFKAGANDMTLCAVRRVVDSGASGENGAALLAMYLLAECGCDPIVLRELTVFMNLEYAERTAANLLNQFVEAVPVPTQITRGAVTDDDIKNALLDGWNQDRIKVEFSVGYGRIKRIREILGRG